MKKALLLLSLLLSLAGTAQAQKVLHLGRYAEANATLEAPEGARVVLYGDSITDGWASQRPEFFQRTGFIADVLDIGASTFVLLAGINDIAMNLGDTYDEDATFANIQSMVELALHNNVRPVICSLLPSYKLGWRPEVTDTFEKVIKLNARLETYCLRHGITYVDYTTVLAGPDGRIRPEFSGDTVHPNAAGYEVMEQLLLEKLR